MQAIHLPLADWSNGVIMIGVFAFVVVIMVAVTVSLMNQGKKKDD